MMQNRAGASRRAGLALVALHWQMCWAVPVLPKDRDDRLLWSGVACSSDGQTVVGVVGGYRGAAGRIYVSRDAGESWAAGDTVRSWRAVASSADGARMVAVEDSSDERKGGFIFTSSDGGSTWSVRTSAGCRHWISVASSADGSRVFAVVGGYTGACACVSASGRRCVCMCQREWARTAHRALRVTLACPARGASFNTRAYQHTLALRAFGAGESGNIYTSGDSGETWTESLADDAHSWRDIAVSADGLRVLACASYSSLHLRCPARACAAPRAEKIILIPPFF